MTNATEQYNFDSLSGLFEYLDTTPRTWKQDESTNWQGSAEWDLNCNFEQAMAYARDGWHDGARNLKAKVEALRPTVQHVTRQFAPAGSRPSAGRYASGNPRCMIRKGQEDAPKPALTIACAINAVGSVSAKHMSNYGLALASTIERLARMGYPVKVVAVAASSVHDTRHVVTWTVKSINAPIHFGDLAFSIGHPAAFRRLGFACRERAKCREQYGYGYSLDARASDVQGRNVILLNGMRKANEIARTPEDAIAYVTQSVQEAMEALGV